MGDKLKVGTIGMGPVGSIVSMCLAEAGADIVVVDIPQRSAQIKKNGLQVRWNDKMHEHRVGVVDSIRFLAGENPDCIFVATKVGILKSVMKEVAEAAGEDCLVISSQNGIGPEDEIARHIPPKNVCRMVVNYAGGTQPDGVTQVNWFNPPNYFGPLTDHKHPKLLELIGLLNGWGLTSELSDTFTIKKMAFYKTILNSTLLPLCAIMDLTMREAMQGNATRPLVEDLVREGLAVAEKLGYEYGEDSFDQSMEYLDKGGDHHPSMSGDLKNKIPTEIEFINGKILEIGRTFNGLSLEVNRVFTSLIVQQEVINGTRNPDDIPDYLRSS
ncbi:MAG: 2-dehydropantoate 2-reductase [Candidatus Latescibacterota bacterium]